VLEYVELLHTYKHIYLTFFHHLHATINEHAEGCEPLNSVSQFDPATMEVSPADLKTMGAGFGEVVKIMCAAVAASTDKEKIEANSVLIRCGTGGWQPIFLECFSRSM
jgi:hypothetical protein